MNSNPREKYKTMKRRLNQVLTENEILQEKLKRMKYKNMLLKKEKDILLANKMGNVSSDSDLEIAVTFPMQFGPIRLESLGEISTKPNFHTDRYIYPIGFSTVRNYSSMLDPNTTVEYNSLIIDGGDYPKFMVTAQDDQQNPIIEKSATACWTTVIRRANKVRNKDHCNSASGPDYFGYSNPKILKLIQEMENADQCVHYKPQKFEEKEKKVRKKKREPSSSIN